MKHLTKQAPKPKNIRKLLRMATRYYFRRRSEVDPAVKRLLKKSGVRGTLTEGYWRLKALNIMLGTEPGYISVQNLIKKGTSNETVEKDKPKFRRKKQKNH